MQFVQLCGGWAVSGWAGEKSSSRYFLGMSLGNLLLLKLWGGKEKSSRDPLQHECPLKTRARVSLRSFGCQLVFQFPVIKQNIKLFLTQCIGMLLKIVFNQLDWVLAALVGAFLLVFVEQNSVCAVEMLFMSALITFICRLREENIRFHLKTFWWSLIVLQKHGGAAVLG